MVTVSASTKFHAFSLAEQLENFRMLDELITTYAWSKNTVARRWIRRVDRENIPPQKIRTNLLLAFPIGMWRSQSRRWNDLFDRWVAAKLAHSNSKVFIGWSGMSARSIQAAKDRGMITILERGSAHIVAQQEILANEHAALGRPFVTDQYIRERELREYAMADYISIPSEFVRRTFLEQGVPESKLVVNPYGVNADFIGVSSLVKRRKSLFRILYVGTLSYRKGVHYLFRAIEKLEIPPSDFEFVCVGKIDPEFEAECTQAKQANWRFAGYLDPQKLPGELTGADISVIPSIEDGFALTVSQLLGAGVPVITTRNTGAADLIREGENGFVVPARDANAIGEKLTWCWGHREELDRMKRLAAESIGRKFTWEAYGERYAHFIRTIIR